jgi:hypothetical protein
MIEKKPLSEQECMEANLIAKGVYRFQVVRGTQKDSPKMGAFLGLRSNVILSDNKSRLFFDNLFFTDDWMWKTRHFYRSVGRMDIYDSGKFMAQDLDNLEGFVEIDHRVNKQTGVIEHFAKDYICAESVVEPKDQAVAKAEPGFDDDLPNL